MVQALRALSRQVKLKINREVAKNQVLFWKDIDHWLSVSLFPSSGLGIRAIG